MITLRTDVEVDGTTAAEVFDFLVDPDDESYRAWWPGTHFELHPTERGDRHVGDVIQMDELVGSRRLRGSAVVTEAIPSRSLVWRFKKGLPLPARLRLAFTDRDGGVAIAHTVRAGFSGPGRILDPLLRLYLSRRFAADLDEHVRTEFPLLRDMLRARRADGRS